MPDEGPSLCPTETFYVELIVNTITLIYYTRLL